MFQNFSIAISNILFYFTVSTSKTNTCSTHKKHLALHRSQFMTQSPITVVPPASPNDNYDKQIFLVIRNFAFHRNRASSSHCSLPSAALRRSRSNGMTIPQPNEWSYWRFSGGDVASGFCVCCADAYHNVFVFVYVSFKFMHFRDSGHNRPIVVRRLFHKASDILRQISFSFMYIYVKELWATLCQQAVQSPEYHFKWWDISDCEMGIIPIYIYTDANIGGRRFSYDTSPPRVSYIARFTCLLETHTSSKSSALWKRSQSVEFLFFWFSQKFWRMLERWRFVKLSGGLEARICIRSCDVLLLKKKIIIEMLVTSIVFGEEVPAFKWKKNQTGAFLSKF